MNKFVKTGLWVAGGIAAKQKIEEKKEQIKSKASKELQKGLKGLFK